VAQNSSSITRKHVPIRRCKRIVISVCLSSAGAGRALRGVASEGSDTLVLHVDEVFIRTRKTRAQDSYLEPVNVGAPGCLAATDGRYFGSQPSRETPGRLRPNM